jgi:hypothetical protein
MKISRPLIFDRLFSLLSLIEFYPQRSRLQSRTCMERRTKNVNCKLSIINCFAKQFIIDNWQFIITAFRLTFLSFRTVSNS